MPSKTQQNTEQAGLDDGAKPSQQTKFDNDLRQTKFRLLANPPKQARVMTQQTKFSSYMGAWLDEYYSSGASIGKAGDFYTSVSVGALFGKLFALRIARILRERFWRDDTKCGGYLHERTRVQIVEIGAHYGYMLRDIAVFLREYLSADEFGRICFAIIEPHAALRRAQSAVFADVGLCVEHICSGDVRGAIIVSNELLDAMPVELCDGAKMAYVSRGRVVWERVDERVAALARDLRVLKGELMVGVWEFLKDFCGRDFVFCGFDYGRASDWSAGDLQADCQSVSDLQADDLQADCESAERERGCDERTDYERGSKNDFSIRAFRSHEILDVLDSDMSELFGRCDITYSVDFAQLGTMLDALGLRRLALQRQGAALVGFLERSGILGSAHEPLITNESNFYQKLKHLTYMLEQFYYFEFSDNPALLLDK